MSCTSLPCPALRAATFVQPACAWTTPCRHARAPPPGVMGSRLARLDYAPSPVGPVEVRWSPGLSACSPRDTLSRHASGHAVGQLQSQGECGGAPDQSCSSLFACPAICDCRFHCPPTSLLSSSHRSCVCCWCWPVHTVTPPILANTCSTIWLSAVSGRWTFTISMEVLPRLYCALKCVVLPCLRLPALNPMVVSPGVPVLFSSQVPLRPAAWALLYNMQQCILPCLDVTTFVPQTAANPRAALAVSQSSIFLVVTLGMQEVGVKTFTASARPLRRACLLVGLLDVVLPHLAHLG